MEREILFRGKRVDNGEWVVGSLIMNVFYHVGDPNSIPYILSVEGIKYDCWEDLYDEHGIYEVDPETVGQYTGLRDKNGTKIFEGDVVRFINQFGNLANCTIVWNQNKIRYEIIRNKNISYGLLRTDIEYEVIGNIHDNPELLEVHND